MKKLKFLLTTIVMISSYVLTAQVAITTDGSSADASAMLEVKSTSKGLLPPRMSTTQRDDISSPSTGLIIYNLSTNSLEFYIGTKWVSIGENGISAPNLVPVASSVTYSGNMLIDQTLTGSYTYSDTEGDSEGTSTFKWYRADNSSGTNTSFITGSTSLTYTLVNADESKYISFEVTPVAQTGTSPGTGVVSDYDGPVEMPSLSIGDSYQGGKVSYIFQSGDPGYVEGETHGIIAASSDQSSGIEWGCYFIELSGADGLLLGDGWGNTVDIINGCPNGDRAAEVCWNLSLNGYSDWYLPSYGELSILNQNRVLIGGFSIGSTYWSSTEYTNTQSWDVEFGGYGGQSEKHNSSLRVRAIRNF